MSLAPTTIPAPTAKGNPARQRIARVRRAAMRWLIGSHAQEAVLGPSAPDWFGLERDPRATLVKVGYLRRTWRVTLADGMVFAKVFERDGGGVLGRAFRWMGMGTAHREWRASQVDRKSVV